MKHWFVVESFSTDQTDHNVFGQAKSNLLRNTTTAQTFAIYLYTLAQQGTDTESKHATQRPVELVPLLCQ